MSNAFFQVPEAKNEVILSYAPQSKEKLALKKSLAELKSTQVDIPMFIGGKKIFSEHKKSIKPPHELNHVLGQYSQGNASHVQMAIDAALNAKKEWENMAWQDRAAIFLKAADLLAGPYRAKMNAATMLGQSKNVYQAEIDAVCELVDFFRFNVRYMTEIYKQQPESLPGVWNRLEFRPLEGFVFALTPFNFTSIAANLCAAPALMGNTVVWKPAETQIYSAAIIMEIYEKAGLPPGVINLVFVDGVQAGDIIFNHREFAGLHFTGSTGVFQKLWKKIGDNIASYKSYPRVVGETGGKDFVMVHSSSDAKEVAVALSRGAFEFQGQKCSAASRAYIPASLWPDVEKYLKEDLADFTMGNPENFTHFINAVIDEKAFDKITGYITDAKNDPNASIVAGGNFDKSEGYFIQPTVILAKDPNYVTMCDELFGPVLTIYVYPDDQWSKTLDLVDQTGPYALTGAVFSQDRYALAEAFDKLRHSAGNFYINDKPTGAVVGQQPFGGGRASGTNDKAGSAFNLLRWASPRTIKENFVPPVDYGYPFLSEE
ncbi:MAG: L-glutamate gamma-semialdehyde dehydrogenase [Saprospiraceae bacterium]